MITELRLVVTEDYLVGAAVTLHSFHEHNRWFVGSTQVFCPAAERDRIANVLGSFPRLAVANLSGRLLAAIETALPDPSGWVPERFYSLQMLAEPAPGDVLLLDSDLLFLGSVEGLAATPGTVVACAEGAGYAGLPVHRVTNEMGNSETDVAFIRRTFNSGLVRLSGELLGPALLDRALSFLTRSKLEALRRRQHDQFVLNRLFEGDWQAADASYNYLLRYAGTIHEATGRRMGDARVLHFNAGPRPWDTASGLGLEEPRLVRAAALWARSYADMIEAQALRRATGSR